MTKKNIVGMIVISLFVAGCAGKHVSSTASKPQAQAEAAHKTKTTSEATTGATASNLPSGFLVDKVVVDLDASSLAQDRIDSAEKYDLKNRIAEDVTSSLENGHHFDTRHGNVVLHINVNKFRLRSGAAAFWLGVMAGADELAVDVKATRGRKTLNAFQTNTSTVLGGIGYTAPRVRVNRMVKTLAKRILAGLGG